MVRVFGVTVLVASMLVLAVGMGSATPPSSAGGGWDPGLSVVPTFITIAPDGGVPGDIIRIQIQINGVLGGIDGAFVEIEFSEDATALIAWSDPVPAGADVPVQTCPTRIYAKAANTSGTVVFHIAGGGCVIEPAYAGGLYIVQVRADDVLIAQREVNSPDVVNGDGDLPTDGTPPLGPVCDAGVMSVSLADAVFHSPFFKSGAYSKCSDLTAPYGGTIELGDATIGTAYIKAGSSASCFAGCP
jgi:hypothetical protein